MIYTDASFCDKLKVAACGIYILINGKPLKHLVFMVGNIENPGDAENFAVVLAIRQLGHLYYKDSVTINTDYKSIVTFYRKNCKRKKELKSIENDLKLCMLILKNNQARVTFNYVRAHNGNEFNTLVDIACRNHLREYRKINLVNNGI